MKQLVNNQKAFLELLKAGLWEEEVRLSSLGEIDFREICRIATEQSVVGLVAAGLENVVDVKVPQQLALQFAGQTIQLEQRNKAMNLFIADLVSKMRDADIYALLVKGQGIAQCYQRPFWRACGDVDLLLSEGNYEKSKTYLTSFAENEGEDVERRHLAMTIDGWAVELHGTLHGAIKRINRVIDEVQNDVFYNGYVRSWMNGKTQVFLPRADEDVIFVFTHILQHYYIEGIGLRQICDWCRLLWTYKDSLNYGLLESRIRKAGIMKEWKSFSAFAVEYLGMPSEAMPFLDVRGKIDDERCEVDKRLKRKADRILAFVMESGNFGHNRDISYKQKYPFVIRYAMSFWLYTKLAIQRFSISPRNAIMAWWAIIKMGANAAAKAI
jgi:hypothetical protein